eukprot:gnl/TRDRNA2_/TRDRNA2_132363_c1_seq1.p1 gnl/TRDRNA2_/TRDRNA2_132363_c1~~gnl/TRDRNA2_/TRDRNA2_132363_c1_seq1.p1  ORF type:complete len:183 (-),score=37.66 gnl/TRDRNA2_/TRDRNA2_132363_c1_seq1:20-547(-)
MGAVACKQCSVRGRSVQCDEAQCQSQCEDDEAQCRRQCEDEAETPKSLKELNERVVISMQALSDPPLGFPLSADLPADLATRAKLEEMQSKIGGSGIGDMRTPTNSVTPTESEPLPEDEQKRQQKIMEISQNHKMLALLEKQALQKVEEKMEESQKKSLEKTQKQAQPRAKSQGR